MPNKTELPRGIRNNNPGNLRRAVIHDTLHKVMDGFAVFGSAGEGLANLAALIRDYYDLHGLKTPFAFVSRYAPANENDTLRYVNFVARRMRCPMGGEKTFDMGLTSAWHVIDLMRAIIIYENGYPPPPLTRCGEWFTPSMLELAVKTGWHA